MVSDRRDTGREGATRRGMLRLTGGAAAAAAGVAVGASPTAADECGSNGGGGESEGGASNGVRFATYNVRDLRTEAVQRPGNEQAAAAATVIQAARPDVLLINEITNNCQQGTATDTPNPVAFAENYLAEAQGSGLDPIEYEHVYLPKSNTGVQSGLDLDNNGVVDTTPGDRTYGNDAFGFGEFPGQYAMALLSAYPLDLENARTMRTFRWTDMPDSLIVTAATADRDGEGYYLTEAEAERFRLPSKTHVDVPVETDAGTIHALAAHPTPPVFDGDENFNGRRCHDEVRLLADYASGARYVYDDDGERGGLGSDESFVVMGDMNASPGDEESLHAANLLLDHERIDARPLPTSPGGAALGAKYATAEFGGGSKVDYVLPSEELTVGARDVVWPVSGPLSEAVATASDHRMVWADVVPGE